MENNNDQFRVFQGMQAHCAFILGLCKKMIKASTYDVESLKGNGFLNKLKSISPPSFLTTSTNWVRSAGFR